MLPSERPCYRTKLGAVFRYPILQIFHISVLQNGIHGEALDDGMHILVSSSCLHVSMFLREGIKFRMNDKPEPSSESTTNRLPHELTRKQTLNKRTKVLYFGVGFSSNISKRSQPDMPYAPDTRTFHDEAESRRKVLYATGERELLRNNRTTSSLLPNKSRNHNSSPIKTLGTRKYALPCFLSDEAKIHEILDMRDQLRNPGRALIDGLLRVRLSPTEAYWRNQLGIE